MQSVPITTDVVSTNLDQGEVHVEETGGHGENHRPIASHLQALSHNVVHLALIEIRTHNISGDWH
jgi:hypothetical protein